MHNKEDEATVEGVQRTVDVANAAVRGNYTGPLVTAVTLVRSFFYIIYRGTPAHTSYSKIPLLKSTSSSPSIISLVLSSILVQWPDVYTSAVR